jgi:hypothetical protein
MDNLVVVHNILLEEERVVFMILPMVLLLED